MYDIRSGVLMGIYQLQRRVNSNNENPSSREFLCEKSTSCNNNSSSMLCNDELTATWIAETLTLDYFGSTMEQWI